MPTMRMDHHAYPSVYSPPNICRLLLMFETSLAENSFNIPSPKREIHECNIVFRHYDRTRVAWELSLFSKFKNLTFFYYPLIFQAICVSVLCLVMLVSLVFPVLICFFFYLLLSICLILPSIYLSVFLCLSAYLFVPLFIVFVGLEMTLKKCRSMYSYCLLSFNFQMRSKRNMFYNLVFSLVLKIVSLNHCLVNIYDLMLADMQ